MGKAKKKAVQYSLSTQQIGANGQQARKLVTQSLAPGWRHDKDALHEFLEHCRGEQNGNALTALLKKEYNDLKAKAHAVVNHAKKAGYNIAIKPVAAKLEGILKPPTGSNASSRNSSVKSNTSHRTAQHGGAREYQSYEQRAAGKKILVQSLEQFQEEVAEPGQVVPQLESIIHLKPGAHGILITTGQQLQTALYNKGNSPESFKEFSAPLVALVPVMRMEQYIGNSEEMHAAFGVYKTDVVIEDNAAKAKVRPLPVWVVNLSKTKVQAKKCAPMVKLKVNQQVELELQIKKGMVSDELYMAVQKSPEKEAAQVASHLIGHLIKDSKGVFKAFEHQPSKWLEKKLALAKTELISAFMEVPEASVKECLAKSGELGVVIKYPGSVDFHPIKAAIIPLDPQYSPEEARAFVKGKIGHYALGLAPIRKDWTRWGLRVSEDQLMDTHQKIGGDGDTTGAAAFPIKHKFIIDSVPRGTDIPSMINALHTQMGWSSINLKQIQSDHRGHIAVLVGAMEPPAKLIIPWEHGALTIRQIGNKVNQPSAWTLKPVPQKNNKQDILIKANSEEGTPQQRFHSEVSTILARVASVEKENDVVMSDAEKDSPGAVSNGTASTTDTGAGTTVKQLVFTGMSDDEEERLAAATPLTGDSACAAPVGGTNTPVEKTKMEPYGGIQGFNPMEKMMEDFRIMMEKSMAKMVDGVLSKCDNTEKVQVEQTKLIKEQGEAISDIRSQLAHFRAISEANTASPAKQDALKPEPLSQEGTATSPSASSPTRGTTPLVDSSPLQKAPNASLGLKRRSRSPKREDDNDRKGTSSTSGSPRPSPRRNRTMPE